MASHSPVRPPKSPSRKSRKTFTQDLPLDLQKHAIEVRKQQYFDQEAQSPKSFEQFRAPPVHEINSVASNAQQEGYHTEPEETRNLSESWQSRREASQASDASTDSQKAGNVLPSPQHTYYLLRALCGLELGQFYLLA